MRSVITFLLFPFLIHSQQTQQVRNYGDVEQINIETKKRDNSWMLNIIGSKFYHDEFIPTIVNGKEIMVKYDALDDFMRSQVGPNLFSFPKNEIMRKYEGFLTPSHNCPANKKSQIQYLFFLAQATVQSFSHSLLTIKAL